MIPMYRITNLLSTSLTIEDLGITLQSRGGQDGTCIISSDSYERSLNLKDLLNRKFISAQIHLIITSPSPQIQKPPPVFPIPPTLTDVTSLQDEIRAMNSRFDEVLSVLRTSQAQAQAHAESQSNIPRYVQIPADMRGHVHDQVSQSSDPIFIPSSIVPKDANVHINSSEEKSSVAGFDDSLAALKAARKKK